MRREHQYKPALDARRSSQDARHLLERTEKSQSSTSVLALAPHNERGTSASDREWSRRGEDERKRRWTIEWGAVRLFGCVPVAGTIACGFILSPWLQKSVWGSCKSVGCGLFVIATVAGSKHCQNMIKLAHFDDTCPSGSFSAGKPRCSHSHGSLFRLLSRSVAGALPSVADVWPPMVTM